MILWPDGSFNSYIYLPPIMSYSVNTSMQEQEQSYWQFSDDIYFRIIEDGIIKRILPGIIDLFWSHFFDFS